MTTDTPVAKKALPDPLILFDIFSDKSPDNDEKLTPAFSISPFEKILVLPPPSPLP